MIIVIPDALILDPQSRSKIKALGAVFYDDLPATSEAIDRIKEAEIVTANYIDITPEIIDQAKQLKYIIVPAVGYEWVDVKYAATKGIKVLNCPTFNSRAVAEHAFALMFALARKISEAHENIKRGGWKLPELSGIELGSKKLGLIGYGNIGKAIAQMAHGIGMTVQHVNSSSTAEEIDELMSRSDIVCVCVPLNDTTLNLVDRRRLELMKPSAFLINIARGAVVDQEALQEIVEKGHIAGAGLDVFVNEPANGQPSNEILKLVRTPGIVATPHIAYATDEAAYRLGAEIYANLQSCLDGKPINVVN